MAKKRVKALSTAQSKKRYAIHTRPDQIDEYGLNWREVISSSCFSNGNSLVIIWRSNKFSAERGTEEEAVWLKTTCGMTMMATDMQSMQTNREEVEKDILSKKTELNQSGRKERQKEKQNFWWDLNVVWRNESRNDRSLAIYAKKTHM